MIKPLLKKLSKIKEEIYEYFSTSSNGYKIVDYLDEHWKIKESHELCWGPTSEEVETYCEPIYANPIFKEEEYTMITVSNCFGGDPENFILDNSKEVLGE